MDESSGDGLPDDFFEHYGRYIDGRRRVGRAAAVAAEQMRAFGAALIRAERDEFEQHPDVIEADLRAEAWYGR